MNTYEIDLDVSKSTVTNSPVVLGQGDKSATTIVARIFDHGSPISASGLTAKLKMRLPDGRHFYEKSATWDATNSKATVTVDETQAASATGETREAYFVLMQGSAVVCSTSRFSVRVLRSATQGMDGAESYSDEIEQLVDDLNAAKTAAQNATAGANSAATAANGAATAANTAATNIQAKADRGDFDGTSPSASVERQTGGALVRVTDRSGTTTAMVYDGSNGDKGDKGDKGDAYEITDADYDEIAARVDVPLMSPDIRGGAKLDEHGGLALRDGALGIGSVTQESSGEVRGSLAGVTAKGHAEQVSTTGKNLLPNAASDGSINGVSYAKQTDGGIRIIGTSTGANGFYNIQPLNTDFLPSGTYTVSVVGLGGKVNVQVFYNTSSGGDRTYVISRNIDGVSTFAIPENVYGVGCRLYVSNGVSANTTVYLQIELGSTATDYEPYTGGQPSPSPDYPQEIVTVTGHTVTGKTGRYVNMEVQGKNLLEICDYVTSASGGNKVMPKPSLNTGDKFVLSAYAEDGTTVNTSNLAFVWRDSTNAIIVQYGPEATVRTATAEMVNAASFSVFTNATLASKRIFVQLERGTEATDYEPYFHSTTPIPLPSRGWVAGLPDGTADTLTIDGAGKVTWERKTEEVVLDGSVGVSIIRGTNCANVEPSSLPSDWPNPSSAIAPDGFAAFSDVYSMITTASISTPNPENNAFAVSASRMTNSRKSLFIWDTAHTASTEAFESWLSTHPVTVLYPLATPVTEELGYVDMPDIPSDATVSIPELDALGVRYFVENSITEIVKQYAGRLKQNSGSSTSPEYYGAVGDGVTDDTEALTKALSSGMRVVFDAGATYKVSPYVRVVGVDGTQIVGNGAHIVADAVQENNNCGLLWFIDAKNVRVDGLNIHTIGDKTIDELNTLGPYGVGFESSNETMTGENNYITNCVIHHVKDGISMNWTRGAFVLNNTVYHVGQEPIAVRFDLGCVVSGNVMHDHGGDGLLCKMFRYDGYSNLVITDNVLYDGYHRANNQSGGGITCNAEFVESAYVTKGVVIANNVVSNCRYGIMVGNMQDCVVSGNFCAPHPVPGQNSFYSGTAAFGLTTSAVDAPATPNVIRNVTFVGNTAVGGRIQFMTYKNIATDVPVEDIRFVNNVGREHPTAKSLMPIMAVNATFIGNDIECSGIRLGTVYECNFINNVLTCMDYTPTSPQTSDIYFQGRAEKYFGEVQSVVKGNVLKVNQIHFNVVEGEFSDNSIYVQGTNAQPLKFATTHKILAYRNSIDLQPAKASQAYAADTSKVWAEYWPKPERREVYCDADGNSYGYLLMDDSHTELKYDGPFSPGAFATVEDGEMFKPPEYKQIISLMHATDGTTPTLGRITLRRDGKLYAMEYGTLSQGGTALFDVMYMNSITGAPRPTRGIDGYYDNESIRAWLARNFNGKIYGYSEPKTTATTITKTGANAGLPNPTLGTLTTEGKSVYRNLGPFQWHACKGHVDSDGVPHIKVIWGVDTLAEWQACDENVWSMRPICWFDVDDTGTSLIGTCSDTWHPGMRAGHWSYLPDGTLRPYMLAARYPLGFEGGVGVSKSGLKCYGRDVSHNSLITKLDMANGGYSGKTAYEQWYDVFMSRMIYGTKDFQLVMQGCTNYSFQYHPAIAETNVKRVILANAQAANLVVGSTMMLGNQAAASTDRNNANCYNVFDGLVIDSITTYDANNKAVNFATDSTFSTATAYLLSTAPWHSGSCDGMDWDGSPTNAQSGKEVAFFQGCELMHGATEVLSGVILHNDGTSGWVPYVVADTRKDATSLTSDFESCGAALPTDANDSWKYPLYIGFHGGLMYGTNVGGSTTTGACDGHYTNKLATTGDREWPSSGHLRNSRNAGPAYVIGDVGLGHAGWYIWSRLSGAGRGFGGES